MPTLRLLSVDARARGDVAQLILDADADVVCLHHAPHRVRWRAALAAIARRSARVVVCAGGRASGANALLSTLGVDALGTRELRLGDARRPLPPGAALATLRMAGVRFAVGCAALTGDAVERARQARELDTALTRVVPDAPPAVVSVLGADRPESDAWRVLAAQRVGAGARLFVDARVTVTEVRSAGGTPLAPAELAVLELPT